MARAYHIVATKLTCDDGEPARLERFPRVRIVPIVMGYLAHGLSAEKMCRRHPCL